MNPPPSSFCRAAFLLVLASLLAVVTMSCSTGESGALASADRYYSATEYNKAEIEYKNLLQKDGQNAHAIGRLGLIYLEQGRLRQAVPYLLKAKELQPENLEVRSKLGMLYLSFGKAAEARGEAEFILTRQPGDENAPIILVEASSRTPEELTAAGAQLKGLPSPAAEGAAVLTALAIIELRQNNPAAAEATLQRALTADPKFASAHSALGALYLSQGNTSGAEQALKTAADLSPLRSGKKLQYAQYKLQTGDREAGRALLEDLSTRAPDYLPAQSLLAEIAVMEKRYDDSAALTAKILAKDTTHPEAALLSARLKLVRGEPAKAAAELEKFLTLYPNNPQALYFLGVAYASAGDKLKAVERLNQAIKLAPMPEAILALASVNLRNGDTSAVIAGLKPLVQQQPNNFAARMILADAYRAQGNVDEALAIYRLSATEFPSNPQTAFQMGLTYLQQRKWTEAQKAFTDALKRSPGFFPALEQLVNLDLARRQYDAALDRVTPELTRNPTSSGAYLLLGRIQSAKGDTKAAETALQKAIELQPDSPTAYYQLAQLYVSSNQQQQALASLNAVTTRNPKDTKAWMTTALILDQQKEYAAARDVYEKILALDPKAGLALNNLAYLYSERLNDLEKGYEIALRARDRMPDEPHTADTLGWILYRKGQYSRALALLEDSAAALPAQADIHYHLGLTRYMMGLEGPARQALERALELDPSPATAQEAKRRLAVLALDPMTGGAAGISTLESLLVGSAEDPIARSRLAALYERSGAPDKAIAAYQAAIAANPSNPTPWLGLARLHAARSETTKALDAAKSARKLAPDDPAVARALGTIAHAAGDSVWAASLLQEAVRKQPDDPELLFETAIVLYSVGQVDAATEMMAQMLVPSTASAQGLFNADLPATSGRAESARQFLDLIKAANQPDLGSTARPLPAVTDPLYLATLMATGARLESKADSAGAQKIYEQALVRSPQFIPAKLRLALLAIGDPALEPKAFEAAQQARSAYPNDPLAAKALGILTYRKGGTPGRALSLLKEAVVGRAQDAEVHYYLGLSQLQQKDEPAARKSLQQALDLGLRGEGANDARQKLKPAP